MRTLVVNALRLGGKRTAIGRHLEHLAQIWSRTRVPFDRVVFMSPAPIRIDRLGTETRIMSRSVGAGWPPVLWEQVILPVAARRAAGLFSMYTCPLSYRGRVVVANHGIYERIPDAFSRLDRIRATPINRWSARRADLVIANSSVTKRDLVEYFGLAEDKVTVVHPGPAELFFREQVDEEIGAEVRRVFGKIVPYLLFVGKLSKRRHIPDLIEAFAVLRREGAPHHLLIVGPNTTGLPLRKLAADHGVPDALEHIPFAEQERLAGLYAGADLFVLPTEYEGLSRTMLEAMACGTAVVTVEHAALAEGGADAVLSVPTPAAVDLAAGMRTALENPTLREALERKGRERAREFSIARCAASTMGLLDRVALPSDRGLPRPPREG